MRDRELRWERRALVVGACIPGPLDELVILPLVAASLYLRKRHVLERHGIAGAHVLALILAVVALAGIAGVALDVALRAL